MEILRFGWWNTSLSPAGKPRAENSPARWEVAREVVRRLVDEAGLDLLALGEVVADDVERLCDTCDTPLLGRLVSQPGDETLPKGIAVLYNRNVLERVDYRHLSTSYMGNTIRRCLHVTLRSRDQSLPALHVFALHWPSNMRNAADAKVKRSWLARDLRTSIHELPSPSHAVILGDFNAEPFDRVLCNDLEASRDRERVRKKGLLYNPLWRHLGERQVLQDEARGRMGAGTYFYRSAGGTSRWYTYDQVLVSASLLHPEGWQLWEEDVAIWQEPPLLEPKTGRPHNRFDHFPIVGSLRRPPR